MNEFGELDGAPGEKEFLAGALLGEGLPPEAEEYLELASQSYAELGNRRTLPHASAAMGAGPCSRSDGLYRFYFYKGRIRQALEIANICLEKAARENALPRDWRKVAAGDAVFDDYEEILPRFFLFTLKGYAYLQMRLGEIDESRAAVMKLLELDPTDKIGAKVLLGILDRIRSRRRCVRSRKRETISARRSIAAPAPTMRSWPPIAASSARPVFRIATRAASIGSSTGIQRLADSHLAHPHFEVRAIAAKFANPFLLPSLLSDPNETVRWEAVRRLPHRYHLTLRNDPHREVRIQIVSLLDGADLMPMMKDEDYYVRIVVARKIDPALLILMIDDAEIEVRRIVAQRIDPQWLGRAALDASPDVRLEAAQRMTMEQLLTLRSDEDWRVVTCGVSAVGR